MSDTLRHNSPSVSGCCRVKLTTLSRERATLRTSTVDGLGLTWLGRRNQNQVPGNRADYQGEAIRSNLFRRPWRWLIKIYMDARTQRRAIRTSEYRIPAMWNLTRLILLMETTIGCDIPILQLYPAQNWQGYRIAGPLASSLIHVSSFAHSKPKSHQGNMQPLYLGIFNPCP